MSQPPYDPTRKFQVPPQQYAPPPAGYQQPVPYGAPPPPPPKAKGGWLKIVGIITVVVVGVCVGGSIIGALVGGDNKGGNVSVSTKAPLVATPGTKRVADNPPPDAKDASDESETYNLAPGTTMTVTADDGGVQRTTVSGFKMHKGACGYGADPDNGSYLIANVVVEQVKGVGSVNSLHFEFVGADGASADTIGGTFGGCVKNDLGTTNSLRAGAKRSGQIAFDVKSAAGTIEYTPGGLFGEAVGSWKTS